MKTLVHEVAIGAGDAGAASRYRIGPNAIIQLGSVMTERLGEAGVSEVFRAAGLQRYLDAPPETMVDEREVVALHRVLRARTPLNEYRSMAWEAGLRTGDYILKHRIPGFAKLLLRLVPRRLATKALTAAIGQHAWTFAGSGKFRTVSTQPLVLELAENPLCRGAKSGQPTCDYYAGTFSRLYGALVDPAIVFVETQCAGEGGSVCRFERRSPID